MKKLNMSDTDLITINGNNVEYNEEMYDCNRTSHFEVIPIKKDDNGGTLFY